MTNARKHLINWLLVNLENNDQPLTAEAMIEFFDIELTAEDIAYIAEVTND